jgi:hypothetical protein
MCKSFSLLGAIIFLATPFVGASVVAESYQQRAEVELDASGQQRAEVELGSSEACPVLDTTDAQALLQFAVHRNGEAEACGETVSSRESLQGALRDLSLCDDSNKKEGLSKYEMEAVLTTLLQKLLSSESCGSTDNSTAPSGLAGFCDMGPERTVIQEDHERLIRTSDNNLPCRFFTREGLRITSLQLLMDLAKAKNTQVCTNETCIESQQAFSLHLYAVPAGRVFMFAPSFVGERFDLKHVDAPGDAPIVVETISLSPRLFEIHNFYSPTEADELIDKALNETSETMGLHRSTTGAVKGVINSKRTSDNAWDQTGATAMRLKRRCMTTLGFDEYNELLTDGLQVLRYKTNQAYNTHPDYLSDVPDNWYNYDSAGTGGNRFATILLYMSDVGTYVMNKRCGRLLSTVPRGDEITNTRLFVDENDGGETLFTKAWPHNAPEEITSMTHKDELERFRATEDAALFEHGSWEEALTAMCRTRLTTKPKKGKAVLFYSQLPNGQEDKMALHGACPVMRDSVKWAANLWVWSGPRAESKVAPRKWPVSEEELAASRPKQLQAYFYNNNKDHAMEHAQLFWGEGSFWAELGHGASAGANTFAGHECKWSVANSLIEKIAYCLDSNDLFSMPFAGTIQVNGTVVKKITIPAEPELQKYYI